MITLVTKFFRLLIACYPKEFRTEFGTEMQAVFAASIAEAQHSGKDHFWKLIWREIRCWPGSALREHLQARRKNMASNYDLMDEKPLPVYELLAALVLFLIPLFGVMLTGSIFPHWINIILVIGFWGSALYAMVLAVIKGLPRWSLSYLGVLLFIVILFGPAILVWEAIYPFVTGWLGPLHTLSDWERVLFQGFNELAMWFMLLLVGVIFLNLLRLLPYTRGVWQRVRDDWTQLSFLVYGGIVFHIVIIFEEYHYDEPWKFAAWTFLALGGWLYLGAKTQRQRILALMGGATLAMWTVAIGKWIIVPLQDWPGTHSSGDIFESGWAIISWVAIIIVMLAPALLNLLPSKQAANVQEQITPA